MNDVVEKVADCLVRAGSTFRDDQKAAYRRAITKEPGTSSCWVMQQVQRKEKAHCATTPVSLICSSK